MIPFASMQNGGGLPLAVSLSPNSASGSRAGSGTCTTNSVTATVTGGVSPYTYAWTASAGAPTSSTTATTGFAMTTGGVGTTTGTGTLTVTDAIGQKAKITVPLTYVQNAVGATVSVSPSSNTQSRAGAGSSPTITFTASIAAWNDAHYVTSWGYQVIESGVGTIINGSSNVASFQVSLNAGQTRSGTIRMFAYTDIGFSSDGTASWSAIAT